MRTHDLIRIRRAWLLIGLLILSAVTPVVVFAREMACGPMPAGKCEMACCQTPPPDGSKQPACPMCKIEPVKVSVQPDLAAPAPLVDLLIPTLFLGQVPVPVEHAEPAREAFAPLPLADHGPPPDLGRAPPVRG